MKVLVHGGINQIGGSCIEIASATTRIILDCGWPLEDTDDPLPPQVPGLFAPGTPPDAVLLTHAHPDHTGFIKKIRLGVKIYATVDTSKIMLVGSVYAKGIQIPRDRFHEVPVPDKNQAAEPFSIGDLQVTGYPVDHSAYGGVGYLIENAGKRVFYTGDLRFHGRKRGMRQRIIQDMKGQLDLLVTEGTNVGRPNTGLIDEEAVETTTVKLIRERHSLVMVSLSPQNLDRFVSFFRAAKQTGRIFVCDHYMASVLHMLNRESLPTPEKNGNLRVYFPKRRKIVEKLEKHFCEAAITLDEILLEPHRFLMLTRPSMIRDDFGQRLPARTLLLYGMWEGYRKKDEWMDSEERLVAVGGEIQSCHASGHAHGNGLFAFIDELNPIKILPVHTISPTVFQARFGSKCVGHQVAI